MKTIGERGIWVLALLCTALLGCGEEGSADGGSGLGELADVKPAGPVAGPESGPDATSDSGSDSSGEQQDDAASRDNFGEPCESADDCESGLCATTPLGSLCTTLCTSSCPSGWSCELVLEGGGFAQYCVPAFPRLCRPCKTNADCITPGFSSAQRCVAYGDAGAFCGGACAEVDCPVGFGCEERLDITGETSPQCVPLAGQCACSPDAVAAEASTFCTRTNEWGQCQGERMCIGDGLTACDAVAPAPEICNGLDDDCNGQVDDGLPEPSCTVESAQGACVGVVRCLGGRQLCDAPMPSPEVCNGVDDNCDGLIDEEGAAGCVARYLDKDADGYGIGAPRCLCASEGDYTAFEAGDCVDDDATINPGVPEVCNGRDDNCIDGVDEPGSAGCAAMLLDADSDGFGAAGQQLCLCAPTGAWASVPGGDCNDNNPEIHPGATEICNGKDDDCDGVADPPGSAGCSEYALDGDGDGWGVTGQVLCLCKPAVPYTAPGNQVGDCDDANPAVKPGQIEVCNGIDDNCDGIADGDGAVGCTPWYRDDDGDGFGQSADVQCLCGPSAPYTAVLPGDCDDSNPAISPAQVEVCNGVDDNCDSHVDNGSAVGCTLWFADDDDDGWGSVLSSACLCGPSFPFTSTQPGDCQDNNPLVHPGATEICNGIDDDCDAAVDEPGAEGCVDYYKDADGDGYGVEGVALCVCGPTGDFSALQWGDCDDDNAQVAPNRPEKCSGVDDNCNGLVDEPGAQGCQTWFVDADGDSFGAVGSGLCLCGADGQYSTKLGGDCDDGNPARNPVAPELCNGVDDDCDGLVDEGCGLPVQGWPTFSGDPRRTAQAFFNQGPTAGKLKWTTALGGPVVGSPVLLPDNRAYALTASQLSFVSATGQLLWQMPLPAPATGQATPTVRLGGTVVVGVSSVVHLISPTGQVLWSTSIPGGAVEAAPVVDVTGRIYALAQTSLSRLDAAGTLIWSADLPPGTVSKGHPALNPNGAILVATSAGQLRAYNPDTGAPVWTLNSSSSSGTGALTVGATGIAYFGTGAGVAAASITGAALYNHSTTNPPAGLAVFNTGYECCIPYDHIWIAAPANNAVSKRNAALSSNLLSVSQGSAWPVSTDYDGDTWITNHTGTLVALKVNGSQAFTYKPSGANIITPPAVGQGLVVVGDSAGNLIGLGD